MYVGRSRVGVKVLDGMGESIEMRPVFTTSPMDLALLTVHTCSLRPSLIYNIYLSAVCQQLLPIRAHGNKMEVEEGGKERCGGRRRNDHSSGGP
jgi:hypothetical protein